MTKLQQLRKERNLSQSELSALSGVNFRTLQDFDQGRKSLANAKGGMLYRLSYALNCTIDDLLSDYVIDIDFELNDKPRFEDRLAIYAQILEPPKMPLYSNYYIFPVLTPKDGIHMEYIYPTKQKLVAKLHDILSPLNEITSVVLFGSSITMKCTYDSDTDLAVRLNDNFNTHNTRNRVSEIIQETCDWKADILWYDSLSTDDRIYRDICKGVQIV